MRVARLRQQHVYFKRYNAPNRRRKRPAILYEKDDERPRTIYFRCLRDNARVKWAEPIPTPIKDIRPVPDILMIPFPT